MKIDTGFARTKTEPAVCPKCAASNCELQATGRKTGVAIVGSIGAILAAGMAGTVGRAVIAGIVSRRPPATILGAIGAPLAGFLWGAMGGHAIGADIDKNILRLYQCRECGFEFKA